MSASVVALGSAKITSDRKALFMEQLAAAYDLYTESDRAEPEAVLFVLGGVTTPHEASWMVSGASEGAADAFIARALLSLQRKMMDYR